jgi:hypothetical protein
MIEGFRRRPRVFIGSSAEQLAVADAIQENLDYEFEPTLWTQDIFRPSSFGLLDLVRASRPCDFAAIKRVIAQFFASSGRSSKRRGTADTEGSVQPPTRSQISVEFLVAEWDGPELSAARQAIGEVPLDHHSDEAQQVRPSLKRVFRFLDGMAAVAVEGRVDENRLRVTFEKPVRVLWPLFFTLLAPPNHADEWWEPPPKLAQLFARWTATGENRA